MRIKIVKLIIFLGLGIASTKMGAMAHELSTYRFKVGQKIVTAPKTVVDNHIKVLKDMVGDSFQDAQETIELDTLFRYEASNVPESFEKIINILKRNNNNLSIYSDEEIIAMVNCADILNIKTMFDVFIHEYANRIEEASSIQEKKELIVKLTNNDATTTGLRDRGIFPKVIALTSIADVLPRLPTKLFEYSASDPVRSIAFEEKIGKIAFVMQNKAYDKEYKLGIVKKGSNPNKWSLSNVIYLRSLKNIFFIRFVAEHNKQSIFANTVLSSQNDLSARIFNRGFVVLGDVKNGADITPLYNEFASDIPQKSLDGKDIIQNPPYSRGSWSPIRSFAFNDAGTLFATGAVDGTVCIWEVKNLINPSLPVLPKIVINVHKSVNALSFHPRESLLYMGLKKGSVCVWDVESDALVARKEIQGGPITQIKINKNNSMVYIANGVGVHVFDLDLNEKMKLLLGATYAFDLSEDGSILVVGTHDKLTVWKFNQNSKKQQLTPEVVNFLFALLSAMNKKEKLVLCDHQNAHLLNTYKHNDCLKNLSSFIEHGCSMACQLKHKQYKLAIAAGISKIGTMFQS